MLKLKAMKKYDCIIVGVGHAGIEASNAVAKLGSTVLLLTIDINSIGKLSCNPAVGGVSKGSLVREVDALGGLIGKITDKCALGYRILNRSKGKAVWSTRVQVDMFAYPKVARNFLKKNKNIDILLTKIKEVLVKNKKVYGVKTEKGEVFQGKSVIICAGTFLKSKIHIGMNSSSGGRLNEESSDQLFKSLKKEGIKFKHFKTGTCARLDKRTIDYSRMEEQKSEDDVLPFSFSNKSISKDSLSCFITYTNKKTHRIIRDNLKYSPLYTGKITSKGVRYCPSLEDKIVKFPQRNRHHIFIEPEGKDSLEVYPNGISTSLPLDIQNKFIHSIEGFEDAVILSPGYGIEYGVIDSRQLYPTLETKKIKGLYFAGQVNGTTGYEEAAAQGLIAGINAALGVRKSKPFIVRREQAYIGVLID
ncbi:MAG: tRNA uridine-5-carboxymethylaminomethyl(34) synthesis enzyme MnmG, partial [Candidatus Omnitrophica bacterium]|nr:tRNA uridine-5-carboxymethylaminomethyl(34) synthesis enzyme MnmG [Candidatus Omnitrophota bacterium]